MSKDTYDYKLTLRPIIKGDNCSVLNSFWDAPVANNSYIGTKIGNDKL